MSFKDRYPVDTLINENEEYVFKVIDRLIDEESDFCTCQDCILDIAAIALNNLPPRYRVFLVRPVHKDEEVIKARLKKVEEVVRNALNIVKNRPHHDR